MSKKRPQPKKARTERRQAERATVKLAEARLKLASLEAGGSPERPIDLTSASVVEPHATGLGCAVCGGSTRVEDHSAVSVTDASGTARSLRVVRVRCTRCGVERDIYMRLTPRLSN